MIKILVKNEPKMQPLTVNIFQVSTNWRIRKNSLYVDGFCK